MGKTQSSFVRYSDVNGPNGANFSEGELEKVKKMFVSVAGSDETHFSYDQLETNLDKRMTLEMSGRLYKVMRSVAWSRHHYPRPKLNKSGVEGVNLAAFQSVLGGLVNGSLLDKTSLLRQMVGGKSSSSVDSIGLMKFLEDLIRAHLFCLETNSETEVVFPQIPNVAIERLGFALLHNLNDAVARNTGRQGDVTMPYLQSIHDAVLFMWLKKSPLVIGMMDTVLALGFPDLCVSWRHLRSTFIPRVMPVDALLSMSVLDIPSVMFLSSQLSGRAEENLWTLLYSTKMARAESLMDVCCLIQHPTLIVVEDMDGYIFGGYAADKWGPPEGPPQFRGNSRCFPFTLVPFTRHYPATGFNHNFMYLNNDESNNQPQGLAFGGQISFFALMISPSLTEGSSCPSYTFNSPQLSSEKNFEIKTVELWSISKFENCIPDGIPASSALV